MTFIASSSVMLPQNLDPTAIYTMSGLTATIAAIASLSATDPYFTGTYINPVIIADKRLWYDSTNDALRVKNSAPTGETDGYILSEG